MTIDLYAHTVSPPARAALVTAQYLGVPVNVKNIDIFKGETRTPEYLKLNPTHTVPTLNDNGFLLYESRAVMAYLANKFAPNNSVYPSDPQARAEVDKLLFFDASGYFPALRSSFFPVLIQKQAAPPQAALDDLKEKIEILETLLGDKKFFAGDNVTLADISLAVTQPFVKQLFPQFWSAKLDAWYKRVETAVPQVAQSNGPIDFAAMK